MLNKITSASSVFYLFINGKLEDILTPWNLSLDFQQETITIIKRNWYLIGNNEYIHAFRFIRAVNVHQRIFGADIEIRSFGNISKAICLKKNDANIIKEALIQYNKSKKGGFIIT
jgi:hypothetical protein